MKCKTFVQKFTLQHKISLTILFHFSLSTLDNCKIEQCYLKLKKDENDLETSNGHLSEVPVNRTEEVVSSNKDVNQLSELELLSKNCHTMELQCSECNSFDECNLQEGQTNKNHPGIPIYESIKKSH